MIICRHAMDLNFAKTANNKSECANYKNGNCGIDGDLCHVDTYIIQTPAFSEVSSRFSLEEKAELETVVGFAKDLLEDNIEMSIISRKSIEYIATVVKRIMAT